MLLYLAFHNPVPLTQSLRHITYTEAEWILLCQTNLSGRAIYKFSKSASDQSYGFLFVKYLKSFIVL